MEVNSSLCHRVTEKNSRTAKKNTCDLPSYFDIIVLVVTTL